MEKNLREKRVIARLSHCSIISPFVSGTLKASNLAALPFDQVKEIEDVLAETYHKGRQENLYLEIIDQIAPQVPLLQRLTYIHKTTKTYNTYYNHAIHQTKTILKQYPSEIITLFIQMQDNPEEVIMAANHDRLTLTVTEHSAVSHQLILTLEKPVETEFCCNLAALQLKATASLPKLQAVSFDQAQDYNVTFVGIEIDTTGIDYVPTITGQQVEASINSLLNTATSIIHYKAEKYPALCQPAENNFIQLQPLFDLMTIQQASYVYSTQQKTILQPFITDDLQSAFEACETERGNCAAQRLAAVLRQPSAQLFWYRIWQSIVSASATFPPLSELISSPETVLQRQQQLDNLLKTGGLTGTFPNYSRFSGAEETSCQNNVFCHWQWQNGKLQPQAFISRLTGVGCGDQTALNGQLCYLSLLPQMTEHDFIIVNPDSPDDSLESFAQKIIQLTHLIVAEAEIPVVLKKLNINPKKRFSFDAILSCLLVAFGAGIFFAIGYSVLIPVGAAIIDHSLLVLFDSIVQLKIPLLFWVSFGCILTGLLLAVYLPRYR